MPIWKHPYRILFFPLLSSLLFAENISLPLCMTKHLEMIHAVRLVIWKAVELQAILFLLSLWDIKRRRKIRRLKKKQIKKKKKKKQGKIAKKQWITAEMQNHEEGPNAPLTGDSITFWVLGFIQLL